jgi:hypothetical protein
LYVPEAEGRVALWVPKLVKVVLRSREAVLVNARDRDVEVDVDPGRVAVRSNETVSVATLFDVDSVMLRSMLEDAERGDVAVRERLSVVEADTDLRSDRESVVGTVKLVLWVAVSV